MRAILFAAVIGLGSSFALAGPSDHAGRRAGDGRRTVARRVKAPAALAGDPMPRRVLVYHDVPKGRGQSEHLPFWVWLNE
jgi:hypothetical protein